LAEKSVMTIWQVYEPAEIYDMTTWQVFEPAEISV